MTPTPADVGKAADLCVVIATGGTFYMRNNAGGFDQWDGKPANLFPYQSDAPPTSSEAVNIFSGVLGLTASLDIYLAYSRSDSSLLVIAQHRQRSL